MIVLSVIFHIVEQTCVPISFWYWLWHKTQVLQVLYLEKVVRGILLQIGIQVGLDCLSQATEAEAHEEWVVSLLLYNYFRKLNSQTLLKHISC